MERQQASTSSSAGEREDQEEECDMEVILDRDKRKETQQQQPRTESQLMMRQLGHLDAKVFSGHLIDTITDEVALEGLDGITIQALKVRLEARPNFDIEGFEDIASAIWNQMKFCRYFKFYILPVSRPDLIPYCWDENRDERGNAYEPLHAPEEIYLYNPIDDKQGGVRGSCVHYETRRDVTHIAKTCGYTDMIQLFGNRLVIVASQYVREKALFGLNYKKYSKLTIVQYCIMERVGRSRYCGEITRGKISSACMNIPPKTLFYMRKHLLKSELILRQSVSVKFANCRCPAGVTVFHLPRFYKRIESISSLNTRTVFSWLNNSATKSVPVETIVTKYGKHTMRALTSQFPTLLETAWEQQPVQEDDAEENEGKKKSIKPKSLRVLRLKQSDMALQNQLIAKVMMDGHAVEDTDATEATETQEEKEEQINIESASSYSDVQVLRPGHQYLTSTENYRLYFALMRSGIGGLTLLDISNLMSLTPLEGRSAGRFLSRHNACKEGVVKIFKQKAFTYILTIFSMEDVEIHLAMQEKFMFAMLELKRIRSLIVERERKRLEKNLRKIKRARAIKARKASLLSTTTTATVSTADADTDTEIQEDGGKEKNAQKGKKISKKKPKPSSKRKTDEASRSTPLVEALPDSLEESSKVDAANKATITNVPLKDEPLMPPPGLCLAAEANNSDKTNEKNVVEPSPGSHLVAVINTRELMEPATTVNVTNDESPSESVTEKDNEETPVEEVYTEGYLDEDIMSLIMTESDEDDEESVSQVRRRNRRGDAVDEEIRKKMLRQRVDWKESEDRFILLAFIASSLFISKYNYSKVFLYNSSQMRDLMLKKTSSKSNKTSAAIRRRVHFLLHQQPRFEEYIGLAGAALRDDTLYENLIKEHMRPPQQKIYFNPPVNALEAVIDYLFDKFAGQEYVVSDTRSSLSGIDTLLFLRQLKRSEFYWNATMFAIFCPMGDTSQSRGAFYRCWRKSNREAREAYNTTTTDGGTDDEIKGDSHDATSSSTAVTRIESQDGEGDEVKTPQDLYLDFCFKFLRFITKHCNIMFKNMLIFGSLNLKGFQVISYDMSTAHSNISSCVRECTSDIEVRLWTARSLVLDFIFSGDSSKLMDKSSKEKFKYPLERATRSLTRARVLVHNKRNGFLCVSRTNLRNFVNGLPNYAYDEMLDLLRYLDEASNVDSLACISVGILHGIVDLTDYFKSSITVTESIFTLNEDWAPLYDGISSSETDSSPKTNEATNSRPKRRRHSTRTDSPPDASSRKRCKLSVAVDEEEIDGIIDDECFEDIEDDATGPSREPPKDGKVGLEEGENYISSSNSNALRLLRIRLNQAGVNSKQFTGFVEKDFFTLNLPNLEFVFPSRTSLNHKIAGSSHPFSMDELKELRKGLVELVYHRVSSTTGNFKVPNMENFLGKYTVLFDLINMTGVVGVSGAYLETLFERKSLVKGLRYLVEAKLVFSVGVAHRRFVSFNNVNDWIIPIRPGIGSGSVGHVIMRPWITSTGGLSWITISRLFTSLLGQLQKPEMCFYELCQVFSPTLSPVETAVLIEVLAQLKYLTIYRIKTVKPSLWSDPSPPKPSDIEYNAEILVDTKDVYVAISPYLTFLHAQLNQAIQKAYKKQSM